MRKGSVLLLRIAFSLIILAISMIHVPGALAEEVIWNQGCGRVFGLLVQGDPEKNFKADVDNMAEIIRSNLDGMVREFRPPEKGEGLVDAPEKIRLLLSELIAAEMDPDDTLIVSIHTHGLETGDIGNGKMKLQLGYDDEGWPQYNYEWQPFKDIQWQEVTAGRIVINIDICYAEKPARDLYGELSGPEFEDKEIVILAGAKIDEKGGADENRPGGYFTNALMDEMRERGIRNLASPSAVDAAFNEIAERTTKYSKDWCSVQYETCRRYGLHPIHFPINIDIIEKISPNIAQEGEEVVISGRHFGFPLPEGQYTDNPNEDIEVSFCQTHPTSLPINPNQPCYKCLVAEIQRRTNTQIIVTVPNNFNSLLDTTAAVYLCVNEKGITDLVVNEKGKVTSSLSLGKKGEFEILYPPEIDSVWPNVVLQGSYFRVEGNRFGDNSVAIVDDWLTIEPHWVDDHYMLVCLPPPGTNGFVDGEHTLKVKRGTTESQSVTFTVVLQHPSGEDLPSGWEIHVTQPGMANDPDDHKISLYEAMLLAISRLERPIETHNPCEEITDPEHPDYCFGYQQREVDFIPDYFDSEGKPRIGGTGYKDTIHVQNNLSGNIMFLSGAGLPPVGNGDRIDFNDIILDGTGVAGAHGLLLYDGVSNAEMRDVTLRNFSGDGIHIEKNCADNNFDNVTIENIGNYGIFIDDNSVQNSFTYPDQDISDFKPNISKTGGHGIYLKNGADRNFFRNVFISDAGGSGIFLQGHAQENHFDKMVVTEPFLHGMHLSGSMVRFNRAIRHKMGKLSDLEAAWDLEDIYQGAGGYGILIENGANSNLLGPRRVFENAMGGIRLDGAGTERNVIGKEYRAVPFNEFDVLPALVFDNGSHGIHISIGASRNIVELINVAGNAGDGVFIEGPNADLNHVSGIWTGFQYFVKGTGTEPFAKPNTGNSVHIANGASDNVIGGFSISRNSFSNDAQNGVLIEGEGTSGNVVQHTDIGRTTRTGTFNFREYAGVGKSGIAITNGAYDNIIGSMKTSMRVHIDASPGAGILIDGSDENMVRGCFLGSPFEYIQFAENEKNRIGIHIRNGAKGNQIGQIGPMFGPDPNPAGWTGIVDRLNQITRAREAGIWIEDAGGSHNENGDRVQPNVLHNNSIESEGIGLKISGDSRVNDIGGWLGGPPGAFVDIFKFFTREDNAIQGNIAGVQIDNVTITNPAERNRFLNNIISSEVDEKDPPAPFDLGAGPLPGVGVLITGNSSGNIIGESSTAPNMINMNRVGVYIDGAHANIIQGNKIGSSFVPNSIAGIVIRNGQANQIGGSLFDDSNILEGNGLLDWGLEGPTSNPNASGVLIVGGQNNIICGNEIQDTSGEGILLINTTGNTIGGPRTMNTNFITNSTRNGIAIKGSGSTSNIIQNNLIGTNWNVDALGNGADGIEISGGASANLIGGNGSITVAGGSFDVKAPNTIAHNTANGVHVSGGGTTRNSILFNSIFKNGGLGISNWNSGNDELPPPTNMYYGVGIITGEVADIDTVPSGSMVNVFWDLGSQGEVFLTETTVKPGGTWSILGLFPASSWNGNFTATVTHATTGSTSEFALASPDWDVGAFNIVRADGQAPGQQTVTFGQGDIPVLVVGVIAVGDSVRVNQLTLEASGSLLENTQIDGVSIYRDNDKDGQITETDSLMAGPFAYAADDGQVDLVLSGVVVDPNDSQQWFIVYETSAPVQEGTTFSTRIADASAVNAEFLSLGMAAVPRGPFPVASDEFTVVISAKLTLTDAIQALLVIAGLNPDGIHLSGDMNGDGKIGIEEVIYILQKVAGLR